MLHDIIRQKLLAAFSGAEIAVTDFSSQHVGHDPGGAHIAVEITYKGFKDLNRLEQHRAVYAALQKELDSNVIHALKIKTMVNTNG